MPQRAPQRLKQKTMASHLASPRYEALKASGVLPSPRGVALAIVRLSQQEDVSMAELARIIRSDPALVGRLIKAANGIVALTRRPVVSVQEALMVLGLPAVRTMALGFSLLSDYRDGACERFDYEAFWSSSLAAAVAAQVFAQRSRAGAPDELFSLGLLSDVGSLALATIYPAEYARILAEARRYPERRLVDLEQRAFAITHTELSAAMLADWGVPQVLVEPVRLSETPECSAAAPGSRDFLLLKTMLAARTMAALCLAPAADRPALLGELIDTVAAFEMSPDELLAAADRIVAMWRDWVSDLALPAGEPPVFSAPIEAAKQRGGQVCQPAAPGQSRFECESGQSGESSVNDEAVDGPVRALVVAADPALCAQLRAVLEAADCQVFEAADGADGLERALEIQPHILLSDWALPQMDGLALVRALRATRIGRSAYIFLLTELDEEDRVVEAFAAGVDDFVGKPVKPRLLAARLHAGLRVVRLQQELERDREQIRRYANELAVSNRRLQEAALTDTLTGLPNRRYAIDRMQQAWLAATRNDQPLACMIIDVDNFKQINDAHGHDAGDRVLLATAKALRGALRGQDVICRTGGDEFLVICPQSGLTAAIGCAERLRQAVDALEVAHGELRLQVSISVGVAARDASMADLDALIKRADEGAYLAKRRGRNRIAAVQQMG